MGDNLWTTLPTSIVCVVAGAYIAIKIVAVLRNGSARNGGLQKPASVPAPVPAPVPMPAPNCPSEAVLQRYNENAIKATVVNKNLVEVIKAQTKVTEENCATIGGLTEAVTGLVTELKRNSRGGNNG